MTRLSKELKEISALIEQNHIESISFDIDGTLYPIRRAQLQWWFSLFYRPLEARRFYEIKEAWEGRRLGDAAVPVTSEDVLFFENFLVSLLNPKFVPKDMLSFLHQAKSRQKLFFLSDHGAGAKLEKLHLQHSGVAINCLLETGELKPHGKISEVLKSKYGINPEMHLHVGDRWSDEAQARDLGCTFYKLICPLY
jgi:FMN phosphatase YigB (HAD superfamily)